VTEREGERLIPVTDHAMTQRALTAKANKQLQESGITKEEMVLAVCSSKLVKLPRVSDQFRRCMQMENLDVLLRLVNWKGTPPCRLPFDPVPLDQGEEGESSVALERWRWRTNQ
jgi:hypothetical protein